MGQIVQISEAMRNLGKLWESSYELAKCPKCGGMKEMVIEILGKKRIVPIMCECEKMEYEKMQKENEYKQRQYRLQRMIDNSLMDSRFRECTFENWDHELGNEKIFNLVKKYAERFSDMKKNNIGLLIWGEPGNGKTYATSCIANYLLERLIPVISVSVIALLNRIKQTFNSYGKEGEAEIIRSLENASLLILDDLGAENNTSWSKPMIYEIIDARYRSRKPLIITTNLTLEELKNRYETRTYDRITEMCTFIHNTRPSLRRYKASKKEQLIKELLG